LSPEIARRISVSEPQSALAKSDATYAVAMPIAGIVQQKLEASLMPGALKIVHRRYHIP
jgi:hypothetical protein